jgi:hypothetical protein
VVVDEDQVVGKTIIDTSSPDGVTAVDGVTTRFAVRSSAVTRQAAAQICLIRAAITTRTSELFEGGRGTTVAETVSV